MKLLDRWLVLAVWALPHVGDGCSPPACVHMCTQELEYYDFKAIETCIVECVLFLSFPSQGPGLKACASMPGRYVLLSGEEYSGQVLESAISSRISVLLFF